MLAKSVIFVIIGALLVAAIYSSSAYFVFAVETQCYDTTKKTSFCQVTEDNGDVSKWACERNPDGKTWRCVELKQAKTGVSIPSELTDALDIAIGESQNTTKVPKSGVLDDGADLTQGDTSDDNDDTGVPEDPGGLNEDDDGAPTINPGQ